MAATCILAIGQSLHRWHDSYSGFYSEHGKSLLYIKRKAQVSSTHKAELAKTIRMSDVAIVVKKLL